MKLLILGGTMFLGRHLVTAARERSHTVTLFNRGKTNPDLFPEVERIRGDRKVSLEPLAGRRFDAVIDTCGYVPRVTGMAAVTLAPLVDHYTFISSISVYADMKTAGQDETAPVATLADETTEEVTGETYGGLKAFCEQSVAAALPGRTLVIRPGLISGPHDPTDRFTYWPVRIARGGEVLAPAPPEATTQHIDARDLAAWTIRAVESRLTGVFNATGPDYPLTWQEILETCRRVTGSDATFTWVSAAFLAEQDVAPWNEIPLWVPAEESGMLNVSVARAIAAGLTFRPLAATIADTLAWHAAWPPAAGTDEKPALRSGISLEREAAVLAAWRARPA
jgi:2'-hydroxyisoflavone reductase